MKFVVTMTTTDVENFTVDATSEEEAVAIVHEMFLEGELDYERPEYDIEFTCGNARETDWVQSLI